MDVNEGQGLISIRYSEETKIRVIAERKSLEGSCPPEIIKQTIIKRAIESQIIK